MSDSEAHEAVAQPRTAAGVLFFDEAGRVLLVKPTYKPGWEIPGGYLRPGETPSEGAAREVKEEIGITPPIGHLLVADWAPHPTEGDKLLFVFDGGILPADQRAQIVLDGVEVDQFAFHQADQIDGLLIPRWPAVSTRRSAPVRGQRPPTLRMGRASAPRADLRVPRSG